MIQKTIDMNPKDQHTRDESVGRYLLVRYYSVKWDLATKLKGEYGPHQGVSEHGDQPSLEYLMLQST